MVWRGLGRRSLSLVLPQRRSRRSRSFRSRRPNRARVAHQRKVPVLPLSRKRRLPARRSLQGKLVSTRKRKPLRPWLRRRQSRATPNLRPSRSSPRAKRRAPRRSPASPRRALRLASQAGAPTVSATTTAPPLSLPESAFGPVDGFVATRSATGIKTDTPIVEIPQSISVITADRMEQLRLRLAGGRSCHIREPQFERCKILGQEVALVSGLAIKNIRRAETGPCRIARIVNEV
jgi:hypothetical protein